MSAVCSAYLSNIRTADSYTGLKNGLENTLRQIPVYGDRLIKGIRSTKQGHQAVPCAGYVL